MELNYVNYNPPKETIILQIQTFKIIDFQLCNLIQLRQRKTEKLFEDSGIDFTRNFTMLIKAYLESSYFYTGTYFIQRGKY